MKNFMDQDFLLTTETAKNIGINVYREANNSTIEGMVDCIINDK